MTKAIQYSCLREERGQNCGWLTASIQMWFSLTGSLSPGHSINTILPLLKGLTLNQKTAAVSTGQIRSGSKVCESFAHNWLSVPHYIPNLSWFKKNVTAFTLFLYWPVRSKILFISDVFFFLKYQNLFKINKLAKKFPI